MIPVSLSFKSAPAGKMTDEPSTYRSFSAVYWRVYLCHFAASNVRDLVRARRLCACALVAQCVHIAHELHKGV